jgi:trehalose 6-phosphate phosphatase
VFGPQAQLWQYGLMILSNEPVRRMSHVLGLEGEAALAAAVRRGPLIGFDFDGTLAPIAPMPDRVRVSQSVSGKLRRLAVQLPVAILSGRCADDVAQRLGFEPYCVVGNHGADVDGERSADAAHALGGVRRQLMARADELGRAGVVVENKELSIALHYRLSPSPQQAVALIDDVLNGSTADCRVFRGKMAENIVPAGLPDTGAAMHQLVRRCGTACAIFVGDVDNDEPVFACAPDDWLTIRIGRDPGSRAKYFLDSRSEIGLLLDRLLTHSSA